MNDEPKGADRPDVEKIIGDIRRHIRQAEDAVPVEDQSGLDVERNLRANLLAVNETWQVGTLKGTGPGMLLRRPVYTVLRDLVGEINTFNAGMVRVLNRLVKILDGSDTEGAEEVLANARRRLTLLTRLSERLDKYEDLQIDTRLERIERVLSELLDQTGTGEPGKE